MLILPNPSPTFTHPSLGYYFTGDGCRRDSDGYYWITGRVDDVINPSGHRIGTAEIESALVACPQVKSTERVPYVDYSSVPPLKMSSFISSSDVFNTS